MNFSKNFPVISGPYPFFYRSPVRLTPLMDTYTSQAASSVSTRPARLIPQKGTYTLHIPSSFKPTISQHPDFLASACRNVLTAPITVPLHTYFSYASLFVLLCSCFFVRAFCSCFLFMLLYPCFRRTFSSSILRVSVFTKNK